MNAGGMTRTETGFVDGSQEKIAGGLEGKRIVITRSAARVLIWLSS